jgi:hypothetical protein
MAAPPAWLKELADRAALLLMPVDLLAPVGCHFCRVGRTWEVTLFVASTQIVGGRRDGVLRHSRFRVDLKELLALFSKVRECTWQPLSLGSSDQLGPHLSIEGTCQRHDVWLRILSRAPRGYEPGRRAIVYQQNLEDTW